MIEASISVGRPPGRRNEYSGGSPPTSRCHRLQEDALWPTVTVAATPAPAPLEALPPGRVEAIGNLLAIEVRQDCCERRAAGWGCPLPRGYWLPGRRSGRHSSVCLKDVGGLQPPRPRLVCALAARQPSSHGGGLGLLQPVPLARAFGALAARARFHLQRAGGFIINLVVLGAVAGVASALTYRYVEAPAMARRRRQTPTDGSAGQQQAAP